jgi:hypothetical protein
MAVVAVPKAAVGEYYRPSTGEYEIRNAGNITPM